MNTVTAPVDTAHALVISRVFDATPPTVFRLWSDPAQGLDAFAQVLAGVQS